ncbi:MAG: diaminopimelate epimerase [Actinomycetes bacterium]|nr:diaminopimelate epimerase [Actinomycetes bacterium]
MKLNFTKMHGLGNDFIVATDLDGTLRLTTEQIALICDRHFGIGADGLMLVRTPADANTADFSWWFANADGSFPEMCGNGTRCFARYVLEQGLLPAGAETVRLETLAGVKTIRIQTDAAGVFQRASVDMGHATYEDEVISLQGRDFRCVSMGNPHAVTFVDRLEMRYGAPPVGGVGPLIETDAVFPNKTNVEFVHPVSMELLEMRVWERGVGETLACATGACATAVAAYLQGYCDPNVRVRLLGGDLDVAIAPDFRITMSGPATTVYAGTIEL